MKFIRNSKKLPLLLFIFLSWSLFLPNNSCLLCVVYKIIFFILLCIVYQIHRKFPNFSLYYSLFVKLVVTLTLPNNRRLLCFLFTGNCGAFSSSTCNIPLAIYSWVSGKLRFQNPGGVDGGGECLARWREQCFKRFLSSSSLRFRAP